VAWYVLVFLNFVFTSVCVFVEVCLPVGYVHVVLIAQVGALTAPTWGVCICAQVYPVYCCSYWLRLFVWGTGHALWLDVGHCREAYCRGISSFAEEMSAFFCVHIVVYILLCTFNHIHSSMYIRLCIVFCVHSSVKILCVHSLISSVSIRQCTSIPCVHCVHFSVYIQCLHSTKYISWCTYVSVHSSVQYIDPRKFFINRFLTCLK